MMRRIAFILLIFVFLTACNGAGQPNATALATVVLDSEEQSGAGVQKPSLGEGGVAASGFVVPAVKSVITLAAAGKVKTVNVAEGDKAKAGDVLLVLEGQEKFEAAVAAAQLALEQAKQNRNDLYQQADAMRIQAMQQIVISERAVRDAQYALDHFTVSSSQADMDAVTALNQMKARLDKAREAFEPYRGRPSSDATRKSLKEDLDRAQSDYDAAVRRLQLEYNLEVAQDKLTNAQQDYEKYKSGPDPDALRLAEMQIENAQAQLAAAQAQLAQLTLTAPFAGTVSKVDIHAGEWTVPGQPIFILADLDNLQVETTDLSERDVPKVSLQQPVSVYVKALDAEIGGTVTYIAPFADTIGGDVVYKVTIELDSTPPKLRAGMSVDVHFGENE